MEYQKKNKQMKASIEKNNLGVQHFLNTDFERAESYYQEAIKEDETNPTTWNNLGLLYHQKQEFEKAINYYHKAIAITPKATYYVNLANTLVSIKQYVEAETYYKKSLTLQPNHENAKVSLAKYYEATAQLSLATPLWEALLQNTPKESYAIALAKNYMALSRYEDALHVLSAITVVTDQALVWTYIGICEFQLHNYGLAENAFKRSLGVAPDRYQTRHYLAITYISKKEYGNAHSALDMLIQMHPEDLKLLLDKALLCIQTHATDTALSYLNSILEKEPAHKQALAYKETLKKQGK